MRFVHVASCALFIVIGVSTLGVSVMVHEIGHAVACVAQGFKVIDINFLMSYVICSTSTQIGSVMGGGMGGLVMVLFLCVRQIRSYLPACLVFLAAMLTQFLNMILEGFANSAYREFDLQNHVLAFGLVVLIAFWMYHRVNLIEWYSVNFAKTRKGKNDCF